MGYIYSGSNTTSPIGKVMDYNNTNPSRGVTVYRMLSTNHLVLDVNHGGKTGFSRSFADAIYGDGPYSLLHPNATTEYSANNIDTLA